METAGFPGDSGSICQQFEGIVYLGLKQRLHDRWRGENPPCPWRGAQASMRKLLSADSFILVDIYQVNYPRSFQMFTTTSAAFRRAHVGVRGVVFCPHELFYLVPLNFPLVHTTHRVAL